MSQLKAIVDKLLSDVSSAYVPDGLIAESVLPFVPSAQASGLIGKYGAAHLRVEPSIKGGRGEYRRVESISRSNTSYAIVGHGLEGLVTKDDYRNVEDPYDAEKDETMGLTSLISVEKEQILATALAATATLTQDTTLSGTSQFSDYDNSDPVSQFATARATIKSGCGAVPNLAVMSWEVKNKLKYHPQMLDFMGFKFNRPGGLNDEELCVALDVDKVLIGKASYNSAKEGQTDTLAAIWGKHVLFAVSPDKAAKYQVSLGYRIGYKTGETRKVYKEAVFNPPGSTRILVEDEYVFLITNAGAGYLIKNAIA